MNNITTYTKKLLLKHYFLWGLLAVWWMMLQATWAIWQSVPKHLPKQHSSSQGLNQNDESYFLYLEKHQQFAAPNQVLHRTVHICQPSIGHLSAAFSPHGCHQHKQVRRM